MFKLSSILLASFFSAQALAQTPAPGIPVFRLANPALSYDRTWQSQVLKPTGGSSTTTKTVTYFFDTASFNLEVAAFLSNFALYLYPLDERFIAGYQFADVFEAGVSGKFVDKDDGQQKQNLYEFGPYGKLNLDIPGYRFESTLLPVYVMGSQQTSGTSDKNTSSGFQVTWDNMFYAVIQKRFDAGAGFAVAYRSVATDKANNGGTDTISSAAMTITFARFRMRF